MRGLIFFAVIAVLSGVESRGDAADSQLVVDFDAAIIKIAPRAAGRRLVRLPSLTFALRVQAQCAGDLDPHSVSISIADTRITLRPENAKTIEKTIRVPQRQLGPVAIESFCVSGETENPQPLLQVHDALSAQVSLHCVGENRESITYQTVALELALQCDLPENAQSVESDASEDATRLRPRKSNVFSQASSAAVAS
jgi:hypothetical protein